MRVGLGIVHLTMHAHPEPLNRTQKSACERLVARAPKRKNYDKRRQQLAVWPPAWSPRQGVDYPPF